MKLSTRRYRRCDRTRRHAITDLGRPAVILMLAVAIVSTGPVGSKIDSDADNQAESLHDLYLSRHFFTLRERLAEGSELGVSESRIGLYHAAVHSAFNRPADSNTIIRALRTRSDLEPAARIRLLHMELDNDLRLSDYAGALEVAQSILRLADSPASSAARAYSRRMLPLLAALADAPPQTAEKNGFSRVALGRTRRVPIVLAGQKKRFALDTGANFSVIMRSEAEELGLEIRPAGLQVSTSTRTNVLADVAVAGELSIGKIDYRNVVFLVFPDEALKLPGRDRIQGLLGFPVVNAMEEIRFRRDDVLEIPGDPVARTAANLALDDLEPLVRVRYNRDHLLCRLDTGAERTEFYEPFYRRYRDRVEDNGKRVTITRGGVGGTRDFDAYRFLRFVISVGGLDAQLRNVDVLTRPTRPPGQNYLDCNLGRDALEQFPAYVLNFRDMALVLE